MYVVCNLVCNGDFWTIISNGGRGGDGQNGGDGVVGADIIVPPTMSMETLKRLLPKPIQVLARGSAAMQEAIESLEMWTIPNKALNVSSTSRNSLFYQGKTRDGGLLTASYFNKNLLILWRGN